MAYIGVSPSNGVRRVHTYTATASQTTFSGAGAEGTSLSYKDSNFVDVYQNGIKLGDADYTSTSGTSIVLAQGASVDDLVVVVVFDVFSVADTVSKADGGTFDGNVTMAGTLDVTGDTTLSNIAGGIVFNEGSADVDFRVESNGEANMLVVDGGNNAVVIGESAADTNISGGTPAFQIIGSAFDSFMSLTRRVASASAPVLALTKSRNTSVGSHTIVQDGDTIGEIVFFADDGTDLDSRVAAIKGDIDGTPGANDTPGRLIFMTTEDGSNSPTERMRISADGRTHFNTGGTALGTGVLQVKLAGTNKAVGIRMRAENAGNWMIAFENSSGTVVGQIVANASSTAYNTSSDHRLKENVTYDFDATTRLKQLKPARFNWIEDETNTLVDGFLAHEVSSIVPEAVTGEKDAVDADGNIDPQGIDQSKLVPLLVKTIQELEARITALENAE